jgi:hypothetical protein
VSAPWLTQLRELTLEEVVTARNGDYVGGAIEDDAWVFGRLRRAGCIVEYRKIVVQGDPPSDDEIPSDMGSDPGDG